MKTIIASLKWEENYEIASFAARAPYFVVFEDWVFSEVIKNPFTVWWWAGFWVAELLKEKNCGKFLAWKIWGNLRMKLEEYSIDYEETE